MNSQYNTASLTKCSACQNIISKQAVSCPKCGQPQVTNNFRQPSSQLGNFNSMPQMAHGGYGTTYQPVVAISSRSRGVYIILGLFLGCLGIHNFYAGHSGKGVAQLLITLILGIFVIGFFITAVWALIDIIAVKTDGNGMRMS